jgi:hypothetical protein
MLVATFSTGAAVEAATEASRLVPVQSVSISFLIFRAFPCLCCTSVSNAPFSLVLRYSRSRVLLQFYYTLATFSPGF